MSQYWYTVSEINPEREREREREREERERERLSITPVYRTVQEGLSMVSCREGITKSKHVF